MTGITKWNDIGDDMFCKSQLITCNRVKECNGVCPFEDALKHADKMQTMNEQHTVDHDRDWIIGCIEHDGFIHTHRFDKANQIIHDALSADTSSDLISRANAIRWVKTECNPYGKPTLDYGSGLKVIEHLKKMPSELPSTESEWIPCSERLPSELEAVNVTWVNHNPPVYYQNIKDVPKADTAVYYRGAWYWWDATVIDLLGEYDGAYVHGIEPIDKDIEVTAWMPLPKPYKGGENE